MKLSPSVSVYIAVVSTPSRCTDPDLREVLCQTMLLLTIGDPANPALAKQVLHENLNALVDRAVSEGLVTGDTDLEVESYDSAVQVTE